MKNFSRLCIAMVLMVLCLSGCSCDHVYGSWTVKTDATCTAEGVEDRACTKCNKTEQRTLAIKAHSYGDWLTTTAATCTEPGRQTKTCSLCGQKEEGVLPLIDHDFGDWLTTKAATCTTAGELTKNCSSCQITDIQTIPASHTWKDATCTEPKTCAVCGKTEGDLLGHKWNDATYQDPKTCTRCGVTEGSPLVPGVSLGGVYVQLNSAAGAEPFIYWKNDSGKVIKYVTFTAVPYNAVNDIVSSTIGNKTYVNLKVTGPVGLAGEEFAERGNYYFANNKRYICNCQPDDGDRIYYWDDKNNHVYLPEAEYKNIYRTDAWEPVWYNSTIRKVVVTKIYVEYMDGTTETINDPPIDYFEFYSKYYG